MCRLPQPMVRKLGKYLHHEMIEHGELSFVVWEQHGPPNLEHMDRQPLSRRVVEKMIREHKFEMDRFIFQIRDKVLPTHINLCFGNMTMEPISGFPRSLLLTADKHSSSPRSSQSPMLQTGLGGVSRAASRYTHGSRRLKRGAAWEPPSLQDSRSLPDLRQYGDPDRVIGLDGGSMSEVVPVKSKPAPVKRPATTQNRTDEICSELEGASSVNSQSAPVRRPTTQLQQRPQEQPSARTTLRNAFRALLWPIRAHPPDTDIGFPEEGEGEAMSQFVPSEHGTSTGPLTMQYYHVDSAENKIYQQWVNLLGPSMGGAWMPVNQAGHDPPRRAHEPAVAELLGDGALFELPAEGRFELSDLNYHD